MARRIPSKPRYKISYQGRNKVWFTKDSRLRRFFSLRGRQLVRRRRLFTRFVLVSSKIKWVIARRFLRPYMRPKFSRPRRLSYRYNFYAKQRFRAFFGKIEEHALRQLFKITKHITRKIHKSFFVLLESRLDVVLYRRRFLPTIFACNQFIRTYGVLLGDVKSNEPHDVVRPGTILSIAPKYWGLIYEYRLTRVFYRVYGKWVRRVRRRRRFIKQFRWVSRSLRRARYLYKPAARWAQRMRLFKLLRTSRLKNRSSWREIFVHFSIINPVQTQVLLKKLDSLEKLVLQITAMFRLQGRRLKLLRKRRYFSGKSFKNLSTNSVVAQAHTYAITQRILNLIHSMDSLEQDFYERVLTEEFLPDSTESGFSVVTLTKLKHLLQQRRFWLQQRFAKDSAVLKLQTSLFLRTRMFSKFFRPFKKKVNFRSSKKRRKRRGGSIRYFLLRLRYKKRRRRRLPRLKKVHWHIPPYRHLNPQTLQVAIVRSPQASELYYPFRSSPAKIISFYKSRGF